MKRREGGGGGEDKVVHEGEDAGGTEGLMIGVGRREKNVNEGKERHN